MQHFYLLYILSIYLHSVDSDRENITPREIYFRNKIVYRLCAENQGERKRRIFVKAGTAKNLQEKIKTVTGVSVLQTDDTHDIICCKCERMVENCIAFRTSCQKAQEKLSKCYSVKRRISPPKIKKQRKQKNINGKNPFLMLNMASRC